MKKILKITIISILSLVLLIFVSMSLGIVYTNYRPRMDSIQYESVDPNYWPTQEWQTSTPEKQGMDSANLLKMVEFYEKEHAKNENIAINSHHQSPLFLINRCQSTDQKTLSPPFLLFPSFLFLSK